METKKINPLDTSQLAAGSFIKNFIKTNLIEVKYSEILMKAEKIQTECDYDDFYMVDESSAQAQFDNAKSFLLRIKNYIEINRLIQ